MSGSSLRFDARWSRLVWVVTVAVILMLALVDALVVSEVWKAARGNALPVLLVVTALLPWAVLAVVALFAPRSYRVEPDGIVVKRLGPAAVIRYERIREIRRISPDDVGFAWRTFGSGGFLGWFGRFYSRRLGAFRAHATNMADLVLVTEVDGTKIVISPHPPDEFLEAVRGDMERSA